MPAKGNSSTNAKNSVSNAAVERELAKLKEAETDAPGQKELAIRETPARRSSIPPSAVRSGAAAVGEKPFERKKPGHQSLSVTGFEDYELPGFDLSG